jgi:hypothetical protein
MWSAWFYIYLPSYQRVEREKPTNEKQKDIIFWLFCFALLCFFLLLFDLEGGKYVKHQMVLHRRENESVSRILFKSHLVRDTKRMKRDIESSSGSRRWEYEQEWSVLLPHLNPKSSSSLPVFPSLQALMNHCFWTPDHCVLLLNSLWPKDFVNTNCLIHKVKFVWSSSSRAKIWLWSLRLQLWMSVWPVSIPGHSLLVNSWFSKLEQSIK